MTDVPPPRWKVVERGRRLVVIDTLTGQEANSGVRLPASPGNLEGGANKPTSSTPFGGLEKLRCDGGGTLTTHAFYDLRGPRTITLDSASAATLGRARMGAALAAMAFVLAAIAQPFILVALPFIAFQPRLRAQLRQGVTRWLDARTDDGG